MKIKVSSFDGFAYSSEEIEVTEKEYHYMYMNDFGYCFIKHGNTLYMKSEMSFSWENSWEKVTSEQQINDAFNPDRCSFDRWRIGGNI